MSIRYINFRIYINKVLDLDYFRYFIYGLIQGITEFIPISSTGHLKIISLLFGLDDPGTSLSAILQLGSVFSIIWYFRNEFNIMGFIKKGSYRKTTHLKSISKSIFIASISILVLGFLIKTFFPNYSNSFLRSNLSIGLASIVMAFLMLYADKRRIAKYSLRKHTLNSSFVIGLCQSLALIPGVSRSGITISSALFMGWKKEDAAKFSFLLGIPSISIAALVEIIDFNFNDINNISPLIFGFITTIVVSLISIDFFVRFISLKGLKLFAYYRIVFGTLIILTFLIH